MPPRLRVNITRKPAAVKTARLVLLCGRPDGRGAKCHRKMNQARGDPWPIPPSPLHTPPPVSRRGVPTHDIISITKVPPDGLWVSGALENSDRAVQGDQHRAPPLEDHCSDQPTNQSRSPSRLKRNQAHHKQRADGGVGAESPAGRPWPLRQGRRAGTGAPDFFAYGDEAGLGA